MTALDAMMILRRFKDRDTGKLPNTSSKCNEHLTVKEAWYLVFKALLKTHGETELPEDLAKAIETEFGEKKKELNHEYTKTA